MRKKTMIYGWYDGMNLGDDAMMLGINNFIKENGQDVVYYNFKEKSFNYFKEDLGQVDYINRYNSDFRIKNKIERRIKKIIVYLNKIVFGDKQLKEVDRVIFMGGGYINSIWYKELKEILTLALIARRSKCKIYFTGQTSGPYNKFIDKFCAKLLYKMAEFVVVRERDSFNLLRDYGVEKLTYGVDDFYLFDIKVDTLDNIKDKDKYFILNIKNFDNYEEGIEKIVKLAKKIYNETGLNIAIVPFGKGIRPKDLECSIQISNELSAENIKNYLVDINSLKDLIDVFSNAEFTLGMAYHSLVISLFFNKNVIGLYDGEYYKSKITGILNHYEIADQSYNFKEITDENLDKITLDIIKKIKHHDYKYFSKKTEYMKAKCRKTWYEIFDISN